MTAGLQMVLSKKTVSCPRATLSKEKESPFFVKFSAIGLTPSKKYNVFFHDTV